MIGNLKQFILAFIGFSIVSCGETPTSQLNEEFPILRSGPHDMEFSLIPKGLFLMGPSNCEGKHCDRQHWVKLTNDFWMQTTELTRAQWFAVMESYPDDDNPDEKDPFFRDCLGGDEVTKQDDHPVSCVSWVMAQEYIDKLNKKNENSGYIYRLPTEAEWEYATRAYTDTSFSIDGPIDSFAWYKDNSGGHSHPVGELRKNFFGLYDVHGNVREVVFDVIDQYKKADNPHHPIINPKVNKGEGSSENKVLRDGAWRDDYQSSRSASRSVNHEKGRGVYNGFRLVRDQVIQ